MIIFAKADGTVINTQPTPIYQGSSLKGSVYLVAPFPNSNGVTIQFQLPNGNVTKAYPMTPTGEIEGVKLDNSEMSVWCWNVKNSMVTAIPGVVGVTIKVYEASPHIIYYGPFSTLNAIENIESPQPNAYAYCIADGKVYKYNGSAWAVGDMSITDIEYLATAIVTSFSVIKGVPNALPVSNPTNEWEAIIALLNEQGNKIKNPLLENITYDTESGVVTKYFNNYEQSTENLPRLVPDTITVNNLVSRKDFKTTSWANGLLTIEKPFVDGDYIIEVYKTIVNGYSKMNPTITVTDNDYKIALEGNAYEGYVLLMNGGTYAETELYRNINSAIENANSATENANNIASTLETAYNNGDFKGEQGEQGVPGIGVPEGGTAGQVLTMTADGTAWETPQCSYAYSPYLTSGYGVQCVFIFPKSLGITEATFVSAISSFANDEYGYDQLYINILEGTFNFCENGVWKDSVTVNTRNRDSYNSDWVTHTSIFSKSETNDTITYLTYDYFFGSPSKVDFIVK